MVLTFTGIICNSKNLKIKLDTKIKLNKLLFNPKTSIPIALKMNIKKNISEKSSEEIIQKITNDYYSSEAKIIAFEILKSRGINYTNEMKSSHSVEKKSTTALAHLKNSILDSFRGKNTLAWAFWGIGLIIFFITLISFVGYEIFRENILGETFGVILALSLIGGPAVHSFCIFRCIKNNNNSFLEKLAAIYASIELIIPTIFLIGIIIELIETINNTTL